MMTRYYLNWTVCVVLLLMVGGSSRADFMTSLTVDVQQQPGSLFSYTYTVADLPASTFPFSAFLINVAPSADLMSINGPVGWITLSASGDSVIEWVSPDPSTDITIGDSGTFSFLSALPAGSQDYLAIGKLDDTLDFNSGMTLGPTSMPSTAAPEPASFTLLGIGIVCIGSCSLYKRKT